MDIKKAIMMSASTPRFRNRVPYTQCSVSLSSFRVGMCAMKYDRTK
jgi:hypothetical protein